MNAKTFLTGKSCKRGHYAPRLVSTRACTECSRLANAVRYQEKCEAIKEAVKKYRETFPEKAKASLKNAKLKYAEQIRAKDRERSMQPERRAKALAKLAAWNKANPEKTKERIKRWARANPEKRAATLAKRRAFELKATPKWADHDAIGVVYLYAQVRREFGENVEVDHIVPLQGKTVCGLHVHDNLQVIPRFDNRSKSNRF